MKITIKTKVLKKVLSTLTPFLEKKDATQITSHVLFIVEESYCTIKATDREMGLQIET